MNRNFDRALAEVLVHEGGYSNHPADPGGATNKGVTQRVYDAYRASYGERKRSVKSITPEEVAHIYEAQYWRAVRGDDLPAGVDYAMFDFAVNSGPVRAAKYLQEVLGVTVDGQIGMITLGAANKAKGRAVIEALCDKRLAFLRHLKTWKTFGKGWSRRVAEVRATALELVQ